ncbi:MAG: RNA pseudouridine synthase [Epsilonproteobacteria bacterium]|nr:RNA pseudouridine synthase [Campylobacterota bacterium]NPA63526.1 RluA family pseudouridine synthase [Campylobacterota bacterium]
MPFVKKVIQNDRPIKLFKLLMDEFGISLREAQKMIDTQKISQNGHLLKEKGAVVTDDVEVIWFEPRSQGLGPLFETMDFAIFDKPSGVMVHPRNRESGYTLVDEVRWHFGDGANIAHRLDKETSGLVLCAKHKDAEKRLKGMFESKKIQKSYLALVRGDLKEELFIDEPIALNRDYSRIKLKVIIDKEGKPAQTIVRPLERFGEYTLVEAIPLTGRQHQIRVHLFHVKHPIVGDPIYGVSTDIAIAYLDKELSKDERISHTGADRLMLHARALEFGYGESRYKIFSKQPFLEECMKIIS